MYFWGPADLLRLGSAITVQISIEFVIVALGLIHWALGRFFDRRLLGAKTNGMEGERRVPMRRLMIPLVVSTALAVWAPGPASAKGQGRQDAYYEVWCTTDTGELVQAESVDAHAIEQGGKGHAIENFNEHYPFGWTCWPVGPFGE
jgi:hypothetical protein